MLKKYSRLISRAAVLFFIFVFAHCGYSQGEFGPHFSGTGFAFLGTHYNNNHGYAHKVEGAFAETYTSGSAKCYAVEMFAVREDGSLLFKKPDGDSFATYQISGPNTPKLSLEDLTFLESKEGTYAVEAWKRAQYPANFTSDIKIGKSGKWVRVNREIRDFEITTCYIGASIVQDPNTGLYAAPVAEVAESRFLVEIVPTENKYRAIPLKNDITLTRGEADFKQIDETAEEILKFAKKQLGE